nr:MAG TPA: hypothetical protein [Caudoviricetes sp.]
MISSNFSLELSNGRVYCITNSIFVNKKKGYGF